MPARHVGRPLRRLEDPNLVTGADPYVNDVRLQGALTMVVARSPDPTWPSGSRASRATPRLGVKGIGESAAIGSTPAVTNAVLDALAPLGIERLDPPLTPATVWAAIQGARPYGGR